MSYQITIIEGNLGSDPNLRYFPDGQAVTNLNVAVNRQWTNRETGEEVKETTWFRVAAYGKSAEAANMHLQKGDRVLVEDTLKADPNTGAPRLFQRQDGTMGASFELRARTVQFLGKANGTNGSISPAQEEDDVPF